MLNVLLILNILNKMLNVLLIQNEIRRKELLVVLHDKNFPIDKVIYKLFTNITITSVFIYSFFSFHLTNICLVLNTFLMLRD